MYLPFELVGEEGRFQTECYVDMNSPSQLKWDFLLPIIENSTKKNNKDDRITL